MKRFFLAITLALCVCFAVPAQTLALTAATVTASPQSIAELRSTTRSNGTVLYVPYHTTAGDGGGGHFRYVSGAAAGTYTDDNGITILPTGGDGSAAWRRITDRFSLAHFGGTHQERFNALIAAMKALDTEGFVPAGDYNLTQGLVLDANCPVLHMDNEAELHFTLGDVNAVAITIQHSQQPELSRFYSDDGLGTGIQIYNTNYRRIKFDICQGFQTGLHLKSTSATEYIDNVIDFTLIQATSAGIHLESTGSNTMEGNEIRGNFVLGGTALKFTRNATCGAGSDDCGAILWNNIRVNVVHCTLAHSGGIYFNAAAGKITANTIDFTSYFEAELDGVNTGPYIGGTLTGTYAGYGSVENFIMNLAIVPTAIHKEFLIKGGSIINILGNPRTHTLAQAGYDLVSASNNGASFNSGNHPWKKYVKCTMTFPASQPAGTTATRWGYHQLLTGDQNVTRPIQLHPISTNCSNYIFYIDDRSGYVKKEFRVIAKSIFGTTSEEVLDFWVEVKQ